MDSNSTNDPTPEQTSDAPSALKKKSGGIWSLLKEVIQFSILALLIVIPIRVYVMQPYIVSGSSMEPTFESSEYLIVDQLSYRFGEPKRGEVIIFRFPESPSKFFIKRIIGLPNEKVNINNGRVVITNNEGEIMLEEPYINPPFTDTLQKELGENEYFVMGDNRRASLDSRIFGPVDEDLIIGRAMMRLFPITKIGIWPGKFNYDPEGS